MAHLRDLVVSRQGYGCMGLSSVYGAADDAESIRTIHRAIDLGVTFLDTATAYGNGHNETLVGRAIADRRDRVTLASKFNHRQGGAGAPPVSPREAVEASLGRLGLDHIDLYYLHRVDLQIPIEDSVGELGRLQDEGKIGGVGVSEATAEGLKRANAAYQVTALQSEYSLWTRGVEVEILAGSEITDPKDRRHQHPRFQAEAIAANAKRRAAIEAVAQRLGVAVGQVSLAWVLSKGVVPIPGTRFIPHLEANVAAGELVLDGAAVRALEAAFPLGSTVGERYPADGMRLVAPDPVVA
jgi:aryl-alcohol dehydrogenase-like predicted oxidoreductase